MATSKTPGTRHASARARANFALVKYWGKADARLNVPAVGSISFSTSRITVDLPEPEAPTTKTKSPFSITKETSMSAATFGS